MDILAPSWFSELGMDDSFLMSQCEMLNSSFDEELAAALKEDYPNTLSPPESNSSSSNLIPTSSSTTAPTTLYVSSPIEASPQPPQNSVVERPSKQHKPNNYNSRGNMKNTTKFDQSSSASFILNFANSNIQAEPVQPGPLKAITSPEDEAQSDVYMNQLDDANLSKGGQGTKKTTNSRKRPPSQTYDHIIAERKRREQLSQQFVALSAIVPGLKKMDKSSVLGDAIKYMKQLQERLKTLEERSTKQTMESVVLVQKSQLLDDDEGSSVESSLSCSNDQLPEIEAKTCGKSVLLRIHCEKHKGVQVKILSEIEKMNLVVVNTSVSSFGSLTLDMTIIAEMEKNFNMPVIDIVRSLRSALRRVK